MTDDAPSIVSSKQSKHIVQVMKDLYWIDIAAHVLLKYRQEEFEGDNKELAFDDYWNTLSALSEDVHTLKQNLMVTWADYFSRLSMGEKEPNLELEKFDTYISTYKPSLENIYDSLSENGIDLIEEVDRLYKEYEDLQEKQLNQYEEKLT